ncbi:Cadmium/zinc-transporting ATPase HMA2 [Abeliophyllum distichum]|uniref:Cadmium/zinc-transporting ATPase HMA2 n=1 Tax=Abeliophyllum distichum TaxID=126358 RepID=A0ABD1R0K7_9LAMI
MEGSAAKKFQKSYFDVLGLCCSSEIPLIEKILKSMDGVKDFSINVPTKTVIVVHDTLLISQLQIVKALNQARLEANIRAYGEKNYQNKWPSPYAVLCGALLLLSFLKYVYRPMEWLALGAVAVGIIPIVLRAGVAVRNLTLDINILVVIAVAGSIALEDYWEAGTIVFLFTIAKWLESRASHKATAVMSSLVNVVPQRAVLADTGEEINADEVKLNTILAVKSGEIIPIDGVVVEGNCEVDEKILTGESLPVLKEKDSVVWASTINLNGYISVKTTALAEDCVVARMAKLVEEAQNNKSRTQRFIDKCAKYYTPVIVVISATLALIPVAFKVHNKKEWYHLALVVLVSGCPCALVLSTPVAMLCALSKAATLGLLFKGEEYLEALASIKIMAFDKTGTITRGEFVVADFKSLLDDVSLNTLLYWVSSIESKSSHPMATALIDFSRERSIEPKPEEVDKFENFPGEGICGKIEDNEIYIGNWKISSRAGCTTVPTLDGHNIEGKSVGYIFLGSSPAGIFSLSDVCRTGSKEALEELNFMGIKTVMLTGDCYEAAKHAQDQLGGALEVVHAELLPEDKARIIKELQKEGPTAMIGDGVNDAPALATANIGISMGVSGSALATETGHIVLMSNDISRIPKAADIARKVLRKVIENVIIAITTKAAILGLAIAGHPLVWAAVLTDVGTCLLVIFNSMLLLGKPRNGRKFRQTHVHKHKCKTTSDCSSHNHKPSCSETESQKKCAAQICSSKKSGRRKCSKSAKKHGCSKQSNPLKEERVMDHQCCDHNKVGQHLEPHSAHNHSAHLSCSEENKCANLTPTTNICISDDGLDDAQHCDHGNHSTKKSKAQTCSSKKSGTRKCSKSAEKHGCSKQSNPLKEERVMDHQCCDHNKVRQHLEPQIAHNHSAHLSCSEENKCANSTPTTNICISDDGLHDAQHCDHGNYSTTTCKSTSQLLESDDHMNPENHYLENHCVNPQKDDFCDQKIVIPERECCAHTHQSQEAHFGCEKHVAEGDEHMHSTINSCSTLDNRRIGGCCDSFRKECCVTNGQYGCSLTGSLSEIVIE